MKKLPSLIGVIHLPGLAGSPRSNGRGPAQALQAAGLLAVKEAQALEKAGFEAIIVENFGDSPFYKDKVPPETVACMAVIASAVRETTRLPIGINILRNDARSALAVAAVSGCDFIRVNVLSGVVASDQGIIEGYAAELLRERDRLGGDVAIFADTHVKHARTLSSDDLALALEETALRGLADGVIITGETTGRPVDPARVAQAARAARAHDIPLYIGSGAAADNVEHWAHLVTGVIVSSTLRKGGRAGQPIDMKRARAFVQAFKKARRKKK